MNAVKRSSSIQIGTGLVGLGLLFVIFVGLDAINGRWSSIGQATLWMAACLALLGGVLVAIGVRRGRAASRVLDEGVSTEATVTAVRQSHFQTTVRDAPSWTIHYRYQDNRGQTFEGQSGDLTQEEAENFDVGDKAMIRFDGRHPGTSAWIGSPPASTRHAPRAVGPPPSWFGLATRVPSLWIGLPFFIVAVMALAFASAQFQRGDPFVPIIVPAISLLPGPLLFLSGLRRVWIWHGLVGHGMRATGTVSAVEGALIGSDRSGRGVSEWQQVIQYRYEDDKGQSHQGRSGYLSAAEASRWREGDPCDIRFDRERPARSVWIGALEGVVRPH